MCKNPSGESPSSKITILTVGAGFVNAALLNLQQTRQPKKKIAGLY